MKKNKTEKSWLKNYFLKEITFFFKDQQFKQKQNKYILTQNFKGK